MVIPASLADPALTPVWRCVRDRLDSRGPQWRGRVRPPTLSTHGRHLLVSLLGNPVRLIDLERLESALRDLGVGDELAVALERLGHPLSVEVLQRRHRRQQMKDIHLFVQEAVAAWPEPWSPEWLDTVWKVGVFRSMDIDQALSLVGNVRRLLDARDSSDCSNQWSRTQLAAMVVGSAHALDRGTRLEAATARALSFQLGMNFDTTDRSDIWDAAGAPVDLVSTPVLTWALPLRLSPLATMAEAARQAGVPFYVSMAALRRYAFDVEHGADVLLVENPRVIEAAMEQGSRLPLICGNGNPTLVVRLLVERLLQAGATVRCHGDFDAAGLAIVGRLDALGCVPWRMDAVDYLAALAEAEAEDVVLPVENATAPPTPWDPSVAHVFETRRRIIHEERLIDRLLTHS